MTWPPLGGVPPLPPPEPGYGEPTPDPRRTLAIHDDLPTDHQDPQDPTAPFAAPFRYPGDDLSDGELAMLPAHEQARLSLYRPAADPEDVAGDEDEPASALDAFELDEDDPDTAAAVLHPILRLLPEGADLEQARRALQAQYGFDFPLARAGTPSRDDWAQWADSLWTRHRAGVLPTLHLAERNRLFRDDEQWVSQRGQGRWRESPAPKDAVRAVENRIGPALAWRLQILSEQRPGFHYRPKPGATTDPQSRKKAEASQIAVEYQYERQKAQRIFREAAYWAQTDGASFVYSYWDPTAGVWGALPEGGMPGPGMPGPDGMPGGAPMRQQPMGDVASRVYRVEQVRVSAEASSTVPPRYVVLRDTLPTADAVARYGPDVLEAHESVSGGLSDASLLSFRDGAIDAAAAQALFRDQPTVDRLTVLVAPSEWLPQGLELVVVGRVLVAAPIPLRAKAITVARVTDGSEDPAYFPRPVMVRWLPTQQRINAVLSKWVESVRRNAGGTVVTKPGAFVGETIQGGNTLIEIRTAGALGDAFVPWPAFSVGNDAKDLQALQVKFFEDITGFNDMARGAMSEDASGRAILARREQLERTFAPAVAALAEAVSDWAQHQVAWMAYGYTVPRQIATAGKGRPDLGRQLVEGADLDGIADVFVDPETLMPKPRSLVLFELDDAFQKGIIGPREYRERTATGSTAGWDTPDEVQEAKARRVCEALRLQQPPEPMLWQDDDAIAQTVLERELLLQPDVDPAVMAAADARWNAHAQQALEKAQAGQPPRDPMLTAYGPNPAAMGMAPGGAPGAAPGGPPLGPPRPPAPAGRPAPDGAQGHPGGMAASQPATAPIVGSNPGVASAPAAVLAQRDDPSLHAMQFDRMTPQ